VTVVVLACYKHSINDKGEISKVDGAWRIVVGLSLIPAFGTLYQRLTLAESKRWKRSKEAENGLSDSDSTQKGGGLGSEDQEKKGSYSFTSLYHFTDHWAY